MLIPGQQAKSLQFLDLLSTVLDRKAVNYIVVCLATAPDPSLVSLHLLDDHSLRPNGLELLDKCPFDCRFTSM